LAAPAAALGLAGVQAFGGAVHNQFQELFESTLGGTPLYVAAWAAILFCGLAALRGGRRALDAMCLAVLLLAWIGPETLTWRELKLQHPWPLVAVAGMQAAAAIGQRRTIRAFAAGCLAIWAATLLGEGTWFTSYGLIGPLHALLVYSLVLAAVCDDRFARRLRRAAAAALVAGCGLAVWGDQAIVRGAPRPALELYAASTVLVAYGYARLMDSRDYRLATLLNATIWLGGAAGRGYAWLRPQVAQLDAIAAGLACFLLAAAISLAKAGALRRLVVAVFSRLKRWIAGSAGTATG
jgi:hypothetical protein